MIERCRGFTILEILLVIMLLGVVARMTIGGFPERKPQDPLMQLQEGAAWAWQQSQLERRMWKMQLEPQRWKLFTLTAEKSPLPGPLPGTFWQPVTGRLAQGTVSEGEFHPGNDTSQPASLLFFPDGGISHQTVSYRDANGNEHFLELNATNLTEAIP